MERMKKNERLFFDGEEAEEIDFYKLYLEELKEITPCSEEEEVKLLEQILKGDVKAKKRLIEGTLFLAVQLAEEYREKGLSMSDLVQEANMALLLSVEEFKGGDFKEQMRSRVRTSIEESLSLQETEEKVEEELLARVNVLKDISAKMAEELGREATLEELAERMKMKEDEIKDIMKLTLDAMSVSGE